jgi:hypothetical protein
VKFDYEPNPSELTIREVDTNTGQFISEQKLENNVFSISDKIGLHIYALDAKWVEEGKKEVEAQATYYFQAEVQIVK